MKGILRWFPKSHQRAERSCEDRTSMILCLRQVQESKISMNRQNSELWEPTKKTEPIVSLGNSEVFIDNWMFILNQFNIHNYLPTSDSRDYPIQENNQISDRSLSWSIPIRLKLSRLSQIRLN